MKKIIVLLCLLTVFLTACESQEPEYFQQIDDFDFSDLPMLTISENNWDGMGFEGYLAYDISELNNGNPWSENSDIKTLPVFQNPAIELSADEMIQKTKEVALSLGLTIDSIYTNPTEEDLQKWREKEAALEKFLLDRYGTAPSENENFEPDSTPYEAVAICGDVTIKAEWYGLVRIFFENGVSLPDGYVFKNYGETDQQAKDAMQYLLEQYASVVAMESPALALFGDYTYYAQRTFSFKAYESSGSLTDRILGYNFNLVSFAPNDEGKLYIIDRDIYDLSQVIGEYPIISAEKARELLLQKQYITTVPEELPGAEYIASVELIYRTQRYNEVFMPYYRFLVELPSMSKDNGLKDFGAYYVPAVEGKYLTNQATIENAPIEPIIQYPSSEEYFYVNRSSAARLCQDGNTIYYSNPYDNKMLYKYNIETNENILLTDEVRRVQYISNANGKIYFSALAVENPERYNIYSIGKDGNNLKLEIENAKASIIAGKYIYFHDALDDFEYGVYRKDTETGETEELISKEYMCNSMTINLAGDYLYAYTMSDIIKYNINTGEITNITAGKYEYGLNKLQYYKGYLYYYTFGNNATIKRFNIETETEEDILMYNGGDFWYDVLLVTDEYIFFTGRQSSALKEGEDESNFVRGTFRYSFSDKSVKKVYERSLSPTCYIADTALFAVLSAEDSGIKDEIIIIDFDGNDISDHYSNLIELSCLKNDKDIEQKNDINTRIKVFLEEVFYDQKIVSFDDFNDMCEDLNNFVFHVGVYRGIVHKLTGKIGEGLTKKMIEDNIEAVFGLNVISKLDYDSYPFMEYDEECNMYIPAIYGAPSYAFKYVLHNIENISGDKYKAVISYIDTNGYILTFDREGTRIIPDNIKDMPESSVEDREKSISELKSEIIQNPEKYERMELSFEINGNYIHLLSAKKLG